MTREFSIRLITPADAEEVLKVYQPYVETTAITFEYELPTVAEFRNRIDTITPQYPWLVCESDNRIVGYAYAHKHRDRTAYQWSPESTIYLSEGYHGLGIARVLYETLFAILRLQGFVNVYAGVLSSNTNSCRFHKSVGFEEIGLFKNIGFKFGEWHGTYWYQLHLIEHPENPPLPKMLNEIIETTPFIDLMKSANGRIAQTSQTVRP